jgi:prepilin-type N-terminal cleavage/methylation domain-containing protein
MYLPPPKSRKRFKGFTLAELLIALAILGVIATFTIPKIITGSQNGQKLAAAKEVASMISGAYQQAQAAGIITGSSKPSDLTPYMNYISLDTSGTVIDAPLTAASYTCNSTNPCIKLANGGVLWFQGS